MHTDLRRPHRTFTIRQLCLEFKCTPRALRFYEDKGLLPRPATGSTGSIPTRTAPACS
jgi:hypothetical protein